MASTKEARNIPVQFFRRYKCLEGGVHIGRFTLSVYFPYLYVVNGTWAFFAKTVVIVHSADSWKWRWAGAIQILGFGIGAAWDYTDNPFRTAVEKSGQNDADQERIAVFAASGAARWFKLQF